MERIEGKSLHIRPDETLALGRQRYDEYHSYAAQSRIPAFFHDISVYLSLDKYKDLSSREIAGMVFEHDFGEEYVAWKALKYAEAISSIKQLDGYEPDELSDDEFDRLLIKTEVCVGISAITEGIGDESIDSVRGKIERHFADLMSHKRLLLLKVNNKITTITD